MTYENISLKPNMPNLIFPNGWKTSDCSIQHTKMQNVIASHWVHNSIEDPWDTGRSNASKRCGCFMMILSSQEISNLSTNPPVRLQSFHLNQIHHNLQWISMDHFKGSLLFCFYTCFAALSSRCHGKLLQCDGCRDRQGNHPTKKTRRIHKFL